VRDQGPFVASATGAADLGDQRFGQAATLHRNRRDSGSLGVFKAKYLIRLMQANAKMFDKFGA